MTAAARSMHRALRQHTRVLRRITPRWLKTYPWYVDAGCDMRRREYRSYDAYVAHQKRKLSHMKKDVLLEYDVRYREALRARLVEMHDLRPGTNVLCLAARLGTEVKAFLDLGCFAVGIDLNPGDDNRYVVVGDFHALQFASGSVDAVFTNSLDHAFDLEKIFAEVRRVLKPGGQFIVEMNWGEGEGFRPLFYEALAWRRVDDVVALLGRCGFSALARSEFEYPWRGQHITFEKASPPS